MIKAKFSSYHLEIIRTVQRGRKRHVVLVLNTTGYYALYYGPTTRFGVKSWLCAQQALLRASACRRFPMLQYNMA